MAANHGGWRVFGASVAGKSHLDKNLPCQDAHAQEHLKQWPFTSAVENGQTRASSVAVMLRYAGGKMLFRLPAALPPAKDKP